MATIRLQSETDILEKRYYEFDPDSEELGRGGMGVVYKGRLIHTGLKKVEDVAIKVLYKDLSEEGVERALKEAAFIIPHDNIVLMRGAISTENNGKQRHYVISEFLDGETLNRQIAREGKTTKEQALHIIRNVLSGLWALHNRNWVHRDIDPSNIMICKDGRVKIIDLGVVKDLNNKLTMYGQFIGKVEYASPEQITGTLPLVKQTSDIYATGIVLYELLTGQLPFAGTSYEIGMGHRDKPLPLDCIPDKSLRYVIRKAAAKKIENRYRSASEFIVDIDKIMNGIPLVPSIAKWLYAAGTAAAVAGLVLYLYFNNVNKEQRFQETLSQASTALSTLHYPEALEAYNDAYRIRNDDVIAGKIEALERLSQGVEAYARSDYELAMTLFHQAGEAGLPDAFYYLGELYYEGLGTPKDFEKGFGYTMRAYEMGFQPAGYRLGLVYQNGIGDVTVDPSQAKRYFERSAMIIDRAALAGNPEWLYMKGNMYMYGLGVEKAEDKAIDHYRQAAEKDYPPALYELFVALHKNDATGEARQYLVSAADKGYVKAKSLLGRILLDERDKRGYELIRQAAEKNYPYALAQMGMLHIDNKRLTGNRQIQEMLGIASDDALSQNYLQKALQYDAENYLANYGLGVYPYTENSLKEAEKYFKVAQKQISELHRTPYREDELTYPNLKRINDFLNTILK